MAFAFANEPADARSGTFIREHNNQPNDATWGIVFAGSAFFISRRST